MRQCKWLNSQNVGLAVFGVTLVAEFIAILNDYVQSHYSAEVSAD